MTAETDRTTLPPAVEQLLSNGIELGGSRPEPDWDRMVESVVARIDEVSPHRGEDDWLFQAPLPLANGERVLRADGQPRVQLLLPSTEERKPIPSDARSLKEIAEAALLDAKRDAAAPLDTTRDAAAPLPHRSPIRSGIHLVALADSVTTPGESLAPPARAALPGASDTRATAGVQKPKRPSWLAGSLALMATLPVAAAVALWLSQPSPPEAPSATLRVEQAADVPTAVVKREQTAPRVAEQTEGEARLEAAQTPQEVAMLPLEAPPRPAARSVAPAPREATKPPAAGATEPAAPPPAAEPPLVPAAEPGARPNHPSVGAAQAAVGSTLGSARLCVAGHLAPSQATVVFGSDGRVLSVRVSGAAEGTPAELCIQRAMTQARVQPFTDPNFSVRTTVRP
jgi:hypothetical protein